MDEKNAAPIPQGKYVAATRYRDLIFTSGMTPREAGTLMFRGRISTSEPIEQHRPAVVLAASNALAAAQALTKQGETIGQVLSLTVFINCDSDFEAHSRLADFASEYLFERFGANGIGSRAAIGASSLPGNAVVEIQMTLIVEF